MSSQRVTCIGIGNMGAALARTLLKTKTPVTIWNRTASRPHITALVESGAEFEPDIASAIARSDGVVIICVLDYDAVYRAFSPTNSSPPSLAGKTIVNLTNGTPRQAREAEAWMKAHGATRYYDGGVMVTPELVGTPQSFVVYSGESEDGFSGPQGVSGLLAPLGAAHYVASDAGAASILDLAALAAMYGMFCGAFTGMGLLKRQLGQANRKEDAKVLPAVEKVMVPLLTALVPYVGLLAKSTDEQTWDDNMGNPLGMQLAGIENIIRACEEEGVDGRGLDFFSSLMRRAVQERGGDGGVAVVSKYLLK